MARQRSNNTWLAERDANTAFFHQQASYCKKKNVIHIFHVDDTMVSYYEAMVEVPIDYFNLLAGVAA